jgi:hypothetical protein
MAGVQTPVIWMGKASCVVSTRICNAQRITRCRHALDALADRVSLCAFR